MIKIIGISGSLRKASTNTGILRYAGQIAKDCNAEFELLDISNLPFVNQDLEENGLPNSVKELKNKIDSADAFIFACPEYNYSFSAPLKNAIDWASRGGNSWAKKPAAIVGAGGGKGTVRAQMSLRQVFVFLDIICLNKPEIQIGRFVNPPPFNENGDLIDSELQERVKLLLNTLVTFTKNIKE